MIDSGKHEPKYHLLLYSLGVASAAAAIACLQCHWVKVHPARVHKSIPLQCPTSTNWQITKITTTMSLTQV